MSFVSESVPTERLPSARESDSASEPTTDEPSERRPRRQANYKHRLKPADAAFRQLHQTRLIWELRSRLMAHALFIHRTIRTNLKACGRGTDARDGNDDDDDEADALLHCASLSHFGRQAAVAAVSFAYSVARSVARSIAGGRRLIYVSYHMI